MRKVVKIKKNCLVCDKEFETYPSMNHVRTCSKKCGYDLKTKESKIKNPDITKQCVICNNEFTVTHKFRKTKTCSRECGRKLLLKTEDRKCVICQTSFSVRPGSKNKCCSRLCANELIRRVHGSATICICQECNSSFSIKTSRIKSGKGKYCSRQCYDKAFKKKSFQKTLNKFKVKFTSTTPLFDIDQYRGTKVSLEQCVLPFKCNTCSYEFSIPYYGKYEPLCPKCFPQNTSKGELEVRSFVESIIDKSLITYNRKDILPSRNELDIYIPSLKISIEYNGIYWHSELAGRDRNYHLNKTKECEKEGITLIHIWESEWYHKQDIIKSKIRSLLGVSDQDKVYARKCIIKEINAKESSNFLDKYHLQGKDNSPIRYGLFDKEELVAVMTFGSLRRSLGQQAKKGYFELVRYASKKSVIGGAGKILSKFILANSPKSIISYADRRFSIGNLYNKLGFKKIHETLPNYWYFFGSDLELYNRFKFRKDRLNKLLDNFDPNISEWKNMQNAGYNRIWDCGSIKYELLF